MKKLLLVIITITLLFLPLSGGYLPVWSCNALKI